MNAVRLRRLQADYEAVRRLVHHHPRVEIEGVSGNPPDRYILQLSVRSLRLCGESLETSDSHRIEIRLPQSYPRDAPVCRMLTPVFHPNIAPHVICVGDHWAASESLDAMIQRIGEMLAYQSYNTKSPLNGQAAQWVDTHPEAVPTDDAEFFFDLAMAADAPRAVQCDNCAVEVADADTLARCAAEHALCDDCVIYCDHCGATHCMLCGLNATCTVCGMAG